MSDRYAAQPFASSYPPARHRPNNQHHPVESGVTAFPVTLLSLISSLAGAWTLRFR